MINMNFLHYVYLKQNTGSIEVVDMHAL